MTTNLDNVGEIVENKKRRDIQGKNGIINTGAVEIELDSFFKEQGASSSNISYTE